MRAIVARWLNDDEQAVWRAYVHMNVLVSEHLERQLHRQAGIPMSYYLVLAFLSEAPDRSLRMQELAQILRVSQSRTSHAIARMEENAWVERRPCADDRRGTVVCLTDAGWEKLTETAPGHVAAVREALFDALTTDQVSQLGEICDAVVQHRDAGCGP